MCEEQKTSRLPSAGWEGGISWGSPEESSAHTSPRFPSGDISVLVVSLQKHHPRRHSPISSTESQARSLSCNERREETEPSSQRPIYSCSILRRLKNCLPRPGPLLSFRMPLQMCPCKSSIRWHPPGKASKLQAKESRCWGSATLRLTKTREQLLDISCETVNLSLWQCWWPLCLPCDEGLGCRTAGEIERRLLGHS